MQKSSEGLADINNNNTMKYVHIHIKVQHFNTFYTNRQLLYVIFEFSINLPMSAIVAISVP